MSIKAETSFSLKDQLFNPETVGRLSSALQRAYRTFDGDGFTRDVLLRFPELELKERIGWMVDCLEPRLPSPFPASVAVLGRALPPPLDPALRDDDFGEFIWVVPGEYVARHGCTADRLDRSLGFLRKATKRFSSENAIRPFLRAFPSETMAFVHDCATDDNYHVRRLASEGIRPFLPWAERVRLDPGEIVAVLDRLYGDGTRYVTRSVANTMNDISRVDPGLVLRTLRRWRREKRQEPAELDWMTRHALRTLLKADDPDVLGLLGYTVNPKFRLSGLATTDRVRVGEAFRWRCTLTSLADQKLRVLLRIHFLKSNGKHSAKTFLVKDAEFGKGEKVAIDKRQVFKPMTTRVLYPGTHHAELVVNGIGRQKRAFEVDAG